MSPAISRRLLPLVVTCIALSFAFASQSWATALLSSHHVPAAAAASRPTGRLSPTNRLDLAIGLPLRNQEALANLLADIYDPASPRYHHYLLTGEFTERFGPSESDYAAVVEFARSNHFAITAVHPNRMLVSVNAAVADIERALHVTLKLYPHPSEARSFYAPDTEPALDLAVPVLHISGLDNLIIPRPANLRPTPLPPTGSPIPLGGSGPQGTYL
ncbi:MAG: protease pro-enzyme activation domain-containing protein, partial [Limisphaerales bacterium]